MNLKWLKKTCVAVFFLLHTLYLLGDVNGIQSVQQDGCLTVALSQEDWPPFFYVNKDGDLAGLDIDIARDLADKLNLQVLFVRTVKTFDEIVYQVEHKQVDIAISYLSNTLDRGVHVRFSDPYVSLYQAALVNRLLKVRSKLGDDIDDVLNFPGVKIGALDGAAAVSFAQANYPNAEVVIYHSNESLITDVKSGKIFAMLSDEMDIKNLLNVYQDAAIDVEAVIMRDRPDTIAMAIPMENEDFQTWLNLYLKKIKEDGFLEHLVHHYIETDTWHSELNP